MSYSFPLIREGCHVSIIPGYHSPTKCLKGYMASGFVVAFSVSQSRSPVKWLRITATTYSVDTFSSREHSGQNDGLFSSDCS